MVVTLRKGSASEQMLELRGRYERHLRLRAARDGKIRPAQAVSLERDMRNLLETSGTRRTPDGE